MEKAFEQVLTVARQPDLTEYDGAYLELAIREGLPLATLDERLRRAATACGISTIGL
jgi:predicted nucleic acid-binding protein